MELVEAERMVPVQDLQEAKIVGRFLSPPLALLVLRRLRWTRRRVESCAATGFRWIELPDEATPTLAWGPRNFMLALS